MAVIHNSRFLARWVTRAVRRYTQLVSGVETSNVATLGLVSRLESARSELGHGHAEVGPTKRRPSLINSDVVCGAGGGIRTHNPLPGAVFEIATLPNAHEFRICP